MGLLKAAIGAAGGTMADQWKEFFYCDALDNDTLMVRGQKQTSRRSSNKRGNDNIISNGSGIAVADGQCMMIVEQGKIVEVCAEPGEYTYDNSTEPSIFTGSLGNSIKETFKTIGKRFTYGGDTGKDQRVYYFNLKELVGNKFGTPNPIPFRIVDRNIGLDTDVAIRCNGVYSYKITDPLLFYTNVCGNVEDEYPRSEIESQLKTEFVDALQPAFAKLSALELRPSAIPAHAQELSQAMNESLSQKWGQLRGLSVVSVAMNPITLTEEASEMIQQAQRNAMYRDPTMAAATLVGAQADAMRMAAANENGAMNGFIGMGLAGQAGGGNPESLFQMGNRPGSTPPSAPKASDDSWTCTCGTRNTGRFCTECGKERPTEQDSWTCSCGTKNTGKFCTECGKKKPEDGWRCACGAVNQGKFCTECGKKKPEGAPLYRCDQCGWEPEDPRNPPKFCPQCGDPFDDNDKQ